MRFFRLFLLLLITIINPIMVFCAQEPVATSKVVKFKGHLDAEKLADINEAIDKVGAEGLLTLLIEIDSTSGDLKEVLETAKRIYSLKAEKGTKVIVYIDDNAIGPSAIIPFLADELYISYFVSWGDIPLGSEEILSTNLLQSRVTSLIPPDKINSALLKLIAEAMCDPKLVLVDDGNLKFVSDAKGLSGTVISSGRETLILNQNQIVARSLSKEMLSPEAFYAKFELFSEPSKNPQETSDVVSVDKIDESLAKHIHYSENTKNSVGYIAIDDRTGGINQSTWIYVKTALDHYKKLKPAFIILRLNTPGGEVYAAQQISDALHEIDTQFNIPVIAFIDNWAISAGAMLAYSCRYISCVKDASMGAASPVIMGEGGQMTEASEKINSAIRTDFANRARYFDRNPNIAEAMVDKDVILVFRHGKVIKLDSEDQIRSKGPNPDRVISNKGKLLTLDSGQLIEFGVADILLNPTKLTPVTAEEKSLGQWPFSKELLSISPFFSKIPNAFVDDYKMDWRTRFFVLLATPVVSSLLMLGLLLGFYIEFNTPGFGVPGIIGATCLVLIIISNMSLEIANWLEVILLFVGFGLILLEVFLLPTSGLLGFVGLIFFIGGLFAIMLPGIGSVDFEFDTQTFNAAGQEFMQRLAWLSGTFVVSFILMVLLARYVTPNLAGLSRLVLQGNEQDASEGYIAGDDPKTLPKAGSKGVVMATLRPTGKVVINDKIYDAVTSGAFLDKGEEIMVEKLDGSVIVVNSITERTK